MTETVALVSTTLSPEHLPRHYQGSRELEEPLDLMYIAAQSTSEVQFRLCFLDDEADLQVLPEASCVIMSTTNSYLQWNNHPMGLRLFESTWRRVRSVVANSTPIIVVGPHVPAHHQRIYDLGATAVLLGESELAAARLAIAITLDGRGTAGSTGVDGYVERTSGRLPAPAVVDLADLPAPAYEQSARRSYNAHNHPGEVTFGHLYEASRGCPYQCTFCNTITHRRDYRVKAPGQIDRDLRHLIAHSPHSYVYFIDESFGFKRGWVNEVFDILEPLPLTYGCQGNLAFLSREKLDRMAAAGFVNIEFGYETANEGVIRGIGKNNRMGKAAELLNYACELGLGPLLFTQIGLPGESAATLRENVRFLRSLDPRVRMSVAMTTPYQDTDLWRMGVSSGLIPLSARGSSLYEYTGRVGNGLSFDRDRANALLHRFGPNQYLTPEIIDEFETGLESLYSIRLRADA